MLVEAGAYVNYKKIGTGLTPLHWAAFNADRRVVNYLLSNGAIL
jgi:ankyrin repeat protein